MRSTVRGLALPRDRQDPPCSTGGFAGADESPLNSLGVGVHGSDVKPYSEAFVHSASGAHGLEPSTEVAESTKRGAGSVDRFPRRAVQRLSLDFGLLGRGTPSPRLFPPPSHPSCSRWRCYRCARRTRIRQEIRFGLSHPLRRRPEI